MVVVLVVLSFEIAVFLISLLVTVTGLCINILLAASPLEQSRLVMLRTLVIIHTVANTQSSDWVFF